MGLKAGQAISLISRSPKWDLGRVSRSFQDFFECNGFCNFFMVFSLAIVWLSLQNVIKPSKKSSKRHFQNSVTFLYHCWFLYAQRLLNFQYHTPYSLLWLLGALNRTENPDSSEKMCWSFLRSYILSNILRLTLGILFELMPDRDLGMEDHSWHPWRVVPLSIRRTTVSLNYFDLDHS